MSNKKDKKQKNGTKQNCHSQKKINNLEESYKIGKEYYENIEETHN